MPIPDFQSLMLPLLELAGDGQEHSMGEARSRLAEGFALSEDERHQLLPSGRQAVFANRVAWAAVYLRKAGLLASPRRGHFVLTEPGRQVLQEAPEKIDMKFLRRFPDYVAWRDQSKTPVAPEAPSAEEEESHSETPDEIIETAYREHRRQIEEEVLELLQEVSPTRFEDLVLRLLKSMGYGGPDSEAHQLTPIQGDEGIDGVIREDRLGLDTIYLQAKRWKGTVGRPEIQKFVGALQGQRARKGVFLTTGSFSKGAREYVRNVDTKVVLLDGEALAGLMFDYDLGVSTRETYEVKAIDTDAFETD